ncbi:pyruvate kinase [Candidatus Poribacteria bacterium]|nr:pyruvate kinase [Candidatus Poribacteria bacterium]
MRRTKIVATIGPSSNKEETLRQMIEAGMDVARLNFSHGTHADHERSFRMIRKLSEKLGKPIGIIGDLQGPKIRTGELADGPLTLRRGGVLIITTRKMNGAGDTISTTYTRLPHDVRHGDRILLDDGSIEVRVLRVENRDIHCRVVYGGALSAHKGINLPGVKISAPSLTPKDKEDVRFAVKLRMDYLAMSFIRQPEDIIRLKKLLKTLGAEIPIIAKVEKPDALANIDGIISVADGVMIARGDLGVEMAREKVPQIQKDLIMRCIEAGKPVITATQMLESMIRQPTPTRAEASDVVNAIYDGTGAVMLSGETAVGDYPVHAVRMMARIAEEADTHVVEREKKVFRHSGVIDSFEDAIGQATDTTARHLRTRYIVCFTSSGFTAQQVSSYRPETPIIAATQNVEIVPRMSLCWGVQPICVRKAETVDSMIANIEDELLMRKMVRRGDSIIITSGYPLGVRGTTNMMQLVKVGEHKMHPTPAGRKRG